MGSYIVREGDSLKSISKYYYETESMWVLLAIVNGKWKRPYVIKENEKLRRPDRKDLYFVASLSIPAILLIRLFL